MLIIAKISMHIRDRPIKALRFRCLCTFLMCVLTTFGIIKAMNDKNDQGQDNQTGSIFESSFNEPQSLEPDKSSQPQNIGKPSDVPPPIDSGDAFLNTPPPELSGAPPVYEENRSKYFIIGGAILFFILIFGGVLAFLIARSGSGGNKEPEPVTLTYWALWEEQAIMQPLIEEYQAKHPHVTIKYELQDPVQYRQKLIERSRNGVGPDIFRFHNTWLPQVTDVVSPIPKELMSSETFEQTFYTIHQSDLSIGEDYYGIPLYLDGLVMVYNDELFKKAGVKSPPISWIGDLQDVVSQLTVQGTDGEIITSGMAMGTASNIQHFAEIYGLLLLQNGGSIDNLNSQAAAESLEVYREFAEKNIWNNSLPDSVTAFAQGKVAIIIVPSWQILTIKAINPDIPLKVAPVPRGLNNQPLSLATYWVEGVSKYSPNQIEAWKFLIFLSEKESLEKLFAEQGKTRLFGQPSSRIDMSEQLIQHEYLGPVIQQADYYQTIPVAARTFDDGLNDNIIQYLENAINETEKGVSYNAALSTAHDGVLQVLTRFEVDAVESEEAE